jgi:hypothetical protein
LEKEKIVSPRTIQNVRYFRHNKKTNEENSKRVKSTQMTLKNFCLNKSLEVGNRMGQDIINFDAPGSRSTPFSKAVEDI